MHKVNSNLVSNQKDTVILKPTENHEKHVTIYCFELGSCSSTFLKVAIPMEWILSVLFP